MRATRAPVSLGFFLCWLLLGLPAQATSISWATGGSGSVNVANALGEPGMDSVTASVGSPLTFSGFSDTINYSQLASTLMQSGVSNSALADMDFIAFDLNGAPGGFEGSDWTFDDGQGNSYSVSHDFGSIGTGILFNGDMTDANYADLFGVPTPLGFVGFILFDLTGQGINVGAPGLTVTLEGRNTLGTDEPDPSGLGVIPEPGTASLLAVGLVLLGYARRRG